MEGASSVVVTVVLVAVVGGVLLAVGVVLVAVTGAISWKITARCSLHQALDSASMVLVSAVRRAKCSSRFFVATLVLSSPIFTSLFSNILNHLTLAFSSLAVAAKA